jgi:hypothetical protein
MELVIIAFLVLAGPLALRYGTDSRRDEHGFFPDRR